MLEPTRARMKQVFGPLFAPLVPAYGTPLRFKIVGVWQNRISFEVTVFTGLWIRHLRFITPTNFLIEVLELSD